MTGYSVWRHEHYTRGSRHCHCAADRSHNRYSLFVVANNTHIFIFLYFCDQAVENQVDQVMLACYGKSNCESITKARPMIWTIKLVGVKLLHLLLCSLSQTNNSFRQNTLRAHLQMTIRLNYLESHPPDLDSTSCGFLRMKDQIYLAWLLEPQKWSTLPVQMQLQGCSRILNVFLFWFYWMFYDHFSARSLLAKLGRWGWWWGWGWLERKARRH